MVEKKKAAGKKPVKEVKGEKAEEKEKAPAKKTEEKEKKKAGKKPEAEPAAKEEKMPAEPQKQFEVEGEYLDRGNKKKFKKVVSALNEKFATEKAMSLFGSKHNVKRRHIFLNEVREVKE